MKDAQRRWLRTASWILFGWILLGLGMGMLLYAAIFSMRVYAYAVSFHAILLSTSFLVRPRWPRLANVCSVLASVAAITYVVLFIMWITRGAQ